MVIDGFTFFNELDLLEIRLNELNDVVDFFVLVESTKTHSNQPKPLFFEENKRRFLEFLPKIKHIVLDDLPDGDDPWEREKFQRRMVIERGFKDFSPLSIGMISDADEIPSAEVIANIENSLIEAGQAITIMQFFCYFYANCILSSNNNQWAYWSGTRVAQIHSWQGLTGREGCGKFLYGGWHMSYLGGLEKIQYKLKSYAHHNDKDHEDFTADYIRDKITTGKTLREHTERLSLSKFGFELWPRHLRDNQNRFSHLIG